MALYRETRRCGHCYEIIPFIPNKPSQAQRIMGFIGDLGGEYEHHSCEAEEEYWVGVKRAVAKTMTAKDKKAIKDLLNTLK